MIEIEGDLQTNKKRRESPPGRYINQYNQTYRPPC
jgi:hypothetical protein